MVCVCVCRGVGGGEPKELEWEDRAIERGNEEGELGEGGEGGDRKERQ